MTFVPGPDFPTGGIIVESRASMAETYRTGRGAFRTRARWHVEDQGRGTWLAVVTEIPYMVQKGRLIEKIAELLNEQEAAARRRSARRIGGGHPRRHRAARPQRRSQPDDGIALPALGAGSAHLDEHERADRRAGAARARPQRGAARLARPSPRGAAAALALPARPDREAPGDPARPADRLSRPRPGDQNHPRGGRAEDRADALLRADRAAGQRHPRHPPARPAQAGGDAAQDRARRADHRRRARSRSFWLRKRSSGS